MLARWKGEKNKQFHEARQNLAVEYQQAKQTLDEKEMAVNATIEQVKRVIQNSNENINAQYKSHTEFLKNQAEY